MTLQGRSAIITGASQGLGTAIAEAFVEAGASLLICARNGNDLQTVCMRLGQKVTSGQQVHARVCDVANPDAVNALVTTALSLFPALDILVNNAGIYGPMGHIEQVDWNEWVQAINVNLMGTVYPCRALLPHLRDRGTGKIINISGGGATAPLPGLSSYAVSKAGVVRFTETLHEEVKGSGIFVNAVAPGLLATRLLDQVIESGPDKVGSEFHRRMVKAREEGGTPLTVAANLCVWLASPASDGVSGKLISAVWDPWEEFQSHRAELDGSDIYTLRRIVPKDRGKAWGDK